MNCPQKGPYYRDRAYRDLFGVSGPYLYFRVPIFSVWFRVTLLANFDFFPCLPVKFHKSLFWVPILAAGGPYWVPILQKVGSLFQNLDVPISFRNSDFDEN